MENSQHYGHSVNNGWMAGWMTGWTDVYFCSGLNYDNWNCNGIDYNYDILFEYGLG